MSLADQKILLLTPPFTQLNTPYPATAYIKGYLNTIGVPSEQADLGIDVILGIFSQDGLTNIFSVASDTIDNHSLNARHIYNIRENYLRTIDPVIAFLQNNDDTLAYLIADGRFLPQASKFQQLDDLEWAFGNIGIRDKARHLATLYLEDLGDFISEVIDPHFGFSRYAEKLGMSANSFDEIYAALAEPISYITEVTLQKLKGLLEEHKPTVVCLTVPFPGNLFAGLQCGKYIKNNYPEVKVVMGGGYPNTELRSLTEPRVFKFVDHITLDKGETPLRNLLEYVEEKRPIELLRRTFCLVGSEVVCHDGSLDQDVPQTDVGTPDYSDLPLKKYLSVIQLTNSMHRFWSDGRWNKLTMAHGCYWGKCTFCDISLDYIKNYEISSASIIVDRMESLIEQTGERGFHFVDEAAPPSVMKAVALEVLRRGIVVTWWTNIRFEKSFSYDLCRLLSASGCVAVSGGLEVASDRLLKMIDKGVTIEQVSVVNDNFTKAGILVHAYLMYGFPTQTEQETIDSLEVVRQMFETGIMQSGFWHRFSMTAHSPVGLAPEQFNVSKVSDTIGTFANNDLESIDPTGTEHDLFSDGLRKSLYNYMHGVGIDFPLQDWFEHEIPATTHHQDMIAQYLANNKGHEVRPQHKMVWIGGRLELTSSEDGLSVLTIYNKQETISFDIEKDIGDWLVDVVPQLSPSSGASISYTKLSEMYTEAGFEDFTLFWYGEEMEAMKEMGLLAV